MTMHTKRDRLSRLLVCFAGFATISFGIWHFFIPAQWDWYSYISPDAPELVIAIRAINAIFSLCLVLIGTADLLILLFGSDRSACSCNYKRRKARRCRYSSTACWPVSC